MDYQIGMNVFGNWTIIKFLGEGGYGKVFEIRKDEYGIVTTSALKVMKIPKTENEIRSALNEGVARDSVKAMYSQAVDELVKEILALSSLKSHPNIVHYEDHSVVPHEDGIGADILIRMELLVPLNDYLLNHTIQEQEVICMARELCSALDYCESKGLVHRDVKPENTFVDDLGHFKLGDFSIARTIEGTSGSMSKKGTDLYMAPEVFLHKSYGKTVDIYSLGLMLYKLMNRGRLPFYPLETKIIRYQDRENALQRRIRGDQISLPVDASSSFSKIIMKACEYQPEKRYQHAKEMLFDLNMISDIQSKYPSNYTNNKGYAAYEHQVDERTTPIGFPGWSSDFEDSYSNKGNGKEKEIRKENFTADEEDNPTQKKKEHAYDSALKERLITIVKNSNNLIIAISAIALVGIVIAFLLGRKFPPPDINSGDQSNESTELTVEPKPTKVLENKPINDNSNSEDANGRIDIASYVGGNIDAFTNKEYYLELTKNDDSEIKWESKYVSITATGNGIITRVRLQREEKRFSVEGLYSGLSTGDFENKIQKIGFDYVGVSSDNKWDIYHNSATRRYIAINVSSGVIESLYYAMDGSLPIS